MKLTQDIAIRINGDFRDPEDRQKVKNTLQTLETNETHRIMRCVLYLAKGDLKTFNLYVDMARVDYRDVIMNAEYEYPLEKHLRDFTKPF